MTDTRDAEATGVAREGQGWLLFAAMMLILGGAFKILDAIWAFKFDKDIPEDLQTILFQHSLASWGWLWLVVGVVLMITGFAVLRGAEWARWVGMIAAMISALLFFQWIFFQPLWTILSVTLMIGVVFVLALFGGRDPIA